MSTPVTCRLCTRSTIGLHDEEFREPSNGTGTQRHLLSKNSVTAAFSAQSLWAAGYQGKGVKMGVFDTGIRDDHPHVKNIKCAVPIPPERLDWSCQPLKPGAGCGKTVYRSLVEQVSPLLAPVHCLYSMVHMAARWPPCVCSTHTCPS